MPEQPTVPVPTFRADEEHLRTLSRSLFLTAFAGGNRISQWQIDRLAPTLDERIVPAGTILYREGDMPDFVYFMEQGEIELQRGTHKPVVMQGKWVVGALESAIELTRLRTAIVLSDDTRLVSVPASVWRNMFEGDFAMVRQAFLGTSHALQQLYSRLTTEQLVLTQKVGDIEALPQQPLDLVERLLAISVSQFTHQAGMQALTVLAESAEEVVWGSASEMQPDLEDLRAQLILSGTVVARRKGRVATVTVGPGLFIPAGILNNPEDWELESTGPIRSLSFRPEIMMDELEEHPDLVRSVLTTQWEERENLLQALRIPEPKIVLR